MAQVIWTEPALIQLEDIAEYIALNNVAAAKTLVQRIFDKTDRLDEFPKSGRKPPELQHLAYREVVVNPCRIFYKVDGNKVYIVHVMRQEQEIKKYLLSGDA